MTQQPLQEFLSQDMSVSTAEPARGTPRTWLTPIAPAADSPTPKTIAGFIKRYSGEAFSVDFSAIKSSTDSLRRMGFSASANSRYVGFLEAFHATPALNAYYEEHYPNCCFLNWQVFREVIRVLKLSCDFAEHYVGGVPMEQVTWLEIFDRAQRDDPSFLDLMEMIAPRGEDDRAEMEKMFNVSWENFRLLLLTTMESRGSAWHAKLMTERLDAFTLREMTLLTRQLTSENGSSVFKRTPLEGIAKWVTFKGNRYWSPQGIFMQKTVEAFYNNFFVVAPPDAFRTSEDFITRTRKEAAESIRKVIPPEDPLVVKAVKGGVLVVAAWGEEAAIINRLAQAVNV